VAEVAEKKEKNVGGAAGPQAVMSQMAAAHGKTWEAKLLRRRVLHAIARAGGAPKMFGRSLGEIAVDQFPHWGSIKREYTLAQVEVALGLEFCRLEPKDVRHMKPLIAAGRDGTRAGVEFSETTVEILRECWERAGAIDVDRGEAAVEQAAREVRVLWGIPEPEDRPSAAELRKANESLREMYDQVASELNALQARHNQLLAGKLEFVADEDAPQELLRGRIRQVELDRDSLRKQLSEMERRLEIAKRRERELRKKYDDLMRAAARQPYKGRSFQTA